MTVLTRSRERRVCGHYHSTRRGGPCVSETRIPGHRVTRVDRQKVAFQSVVVAKLDGLVITMYIRREKERERVSLDHSFVLGACSSNAQAPVSQSSHEGGIVSGKQSLLDLIALNGLTGKQEVEKHDQEDCREKGSGGHQALEERGSRIVLVWAWPRIRAAATRSRPSRRFVSPNASAPPPVVRTRYSQTNQRA